MGQMISYVMDRLIELIREAMQPSKCRRPTKPTKGAKKRRPEGKRRQGDIKKTRRSVSHDD